MTHVSQIVLNWTAWVCYNKNTYDVEERWRRAISKALGKNIWREIRATLGRFIAILAISALGAGFYAGLKTTGPDMRTTADQYYADQHLMDFRILSTLGFTQEEVDLLRQRSEIQHLAAGYSLDVLMSTTEGSEAYRLHSLPEDLSPDNPDYLNRPVLVKGRLPEKAGECLIDSKSHHAIGDKIQVSDENEQKTRDLLEVSSFEVVGVASSPAYISFLRGNTTIGNGRVAYFMYTPAASFEQEFYTEIYATAKGAEGLSAFSSAYERLVDRNAKNLDSFGQEQVQKRYDEIVRDGNAELKDARRKLADAKKELEEGKATADKELADALAKLQEGDREVAKGEREIRDNAKKLADADKEITDGSKALAEARPILDQAQKKYDDGVAAYAKGLAEYQAGFEQVQQLQAGIDAIPPSLQAMSDMTAGGTMEPPPEMVPAYLQAAGTLVQVAEGAGIFMEQAGQPQAAAGLNGIAQRGSAAMESAQQTGQFAPVYAELAPLGTLTGDLSAAVSGTQAQLQQAKSKLDVAAKELAEAKIKLDKGWAEFSENEQKLADARIELEDGKKKLADARIELADAKAELQEGWLTYEEEKADALQKIADGEKEIADGEQEVADGQKKLDDLKQPEWFVFTREDNPGYSGFASDAGRIGALATVIPLFFFLVAALVCLTTITRMVEEQRSLIGTLKGLGYSGGSIAFKYLIYAGVASTVGGILGVAVGFYAFPVAIWRAYGMMYIMPPIDLWNEWPLAVSSVLFAALCSTLAAWSACGHELRSVPASLMRPKAPRSGKRVLLERIGFLWKRMSFMQKVTARNLFRYKKRFFMKVIGVAGCSALLVTGFGLRDSIAGVVGLQYNTIYNYDVMAVLTEHSDSKAQTQVNQLVPQYGTSLYTGQTLAKAKSAGGSSGDMTLYIYVAEQPEEMSQFIDLHQRKTGQKIDFPGTSGVVVTEKLADRLKAKPGDTIQVNRINESPVDVTVGAVSENYLLNYIYMTPQEYTRLFGEAPEFDTMLIRLNEQSGENLDQVLTDLVAAKPVAGAQDIASLREQFDDMFDSLDAIVWLIIAAAGMLAFVVLYNLTNINITERAREIATLKVLGFYSGEVASYIYKENFVLTLIGTLTGIALGVVLHDFVILTAEVDEVMFRRVIEPLSYVLAILFTLLCAGLVDLFMLPRLRKVDMIESLKSNE